MIDVAQIVNELLLELGKESDRMVYRAEGVRLLYNRIVKEAQDGTPSNGQEPESSQPVSEESGQTKTDPA